MNDPTKDSPTRRLLVSAVSLAALLVAPIASADSPAPVLVPPRLLEAVDPEITDEQRTTLTVPSVLLELQLDTEGAVADARVLEGSGVAEVDASVLAAAARLRFEPATQDGVPIPAVIAFRFSLLPALPPSPEAGEPARSPGESASTGPSTTTDPASTTAPGAPQTSATASAARATSVPDDLEVADIEVEVRGEAPPREATRHAIEGVEVRRIPGTNGDALRAIETMPGVARPPGFEGLLVVRGSAPQDTQVFVDGALIPLAYHFGGISSVVPSELLERLEFRPGNFGSEYGRGMGGVVSLDLRSPRREGFAGIVQVDALDARFVVEGALGERTRFMLAGRRSWVDAWLGRVFEGSGTRVRTAPVYWDWQAILEHDVNARTTVRLMFIGADDRIALIVDAPDAQDPEFGGALSGRTAFTRLQLRVDSRLREGLRWTQAITFGTEALSLRVGDNYALADTYTLQGRSEVRASLGRAATVVGGLDVLWASYDVSLRLAPYPTANETPGPNFGRPARVVEAQPRTFRPGAYAQLELTPTPGLRLMPGVRVDYAQDNGRVTVDPRFALRWDVVSTPRRTTLKAAAGLYHQPPQPVESLLDRAFTVRSSASTHLSLGVEQQLTSHFDVSLEGFWKRFDDLPVARGADTDSVIGVRFDNAGEGRAYGGELMLRYRPGGGPFFGWLAYTLSRSERRDGSHGPYETMEWDQTHIVSAVGSVDLGRGWSLGGRFRFVTGAPHTPYVGGVVDLDAGAYEPVTDQGAFSGRLASFHQLDLRVDKTWTFEAMRLTAYLDIRNVYNRSNPEGIHYNFDYTQSAPMAGLPFLPVIGLRGEL
ncbi:MAG: TonB-dependent receptor [Polyangiales bacterium]